ncbi:diguanylate cyclase domain-containing protein [Dongia sp.]|uniref:diguanylate cyclase domain-containing protein n=1 Tax=Dongia sp. TaxID=1977262 RepID=UPI0037538301
MSEHKPIDMAPDAVRPKGGVRDYLAKIAATLPGTVYAFRLAPDGTLSIPYAAPSLTELCGFAPATVEADAAPLLAAMPEDDRARLLASMHASAERLTMWEQHFRLQHPTKGLIWIAACATPERASDGGTVWHGFARDVTGSRRDDEARRLAAAVFNNTQEGVVITDPDGRILAANPSVSAITGYDRDELLGNTMRLLRSGRHDQAFYDSMWEAVRTVGYWQGEIWNRRKNGEIYPELLTISTVRDEQGEIANYVGSFSDITLWKRSQQRLEHLAHHDALTGLPNRLMLLTRLEHALSRARRDKGLGAVLFLDLDRFKQVNDTLGHPAGDALLIAVANRLRERLRDADTLARLGGDEFVIVLEQLSDRDRAAALAKELIARLSEPFELPGGHIARIGASVGISLFPADGILPDELIRHADAALYISKQSGRGTYRFYRDAAPVMKST